MLECELFSDRRRERGGEDREEDGTAGVGMSTGVGQRARWGRAGGEGEGGRGKEGEGRGGEGDRIPVMVMGRGKSEGKQAG